MHFLIKKICLKLVLLKKKYLKISKDAAGGTGAIADTSVLRQRISDVKRNVKSGSSSIDSPERLAKPTPANPKGIKPNSPEHMAMLKRKLKNRQKGIKTAAKRIYAKPETAEYVPQGTELDEARSVDSAMSIISSIVKNKQAGEIIHGDRKKSKVDLYSASAIQQVYNALNRKNQEKMEKVISKNRQGLAKMADFSMSMMK